MTAYAQGAAFWPLAVARELDDLILDLRTNETEIGTWVFKTEGDAARVLAHDELLLAELRPRLAGPGDRAVLEAHAQAARRHRPGR